MLKGSGFGFRGSGFGFRLPRRSDTGSCPWNPSTFQAASFRAGSALGWGLRVRGESSGFRVQGSGCRVQGAGFRVQGSGLTDSGKRVATTPRSHPNAHPLPGTRPPYAHPDTPGAQPFQGTGCRVQGAGCRVRVQGSRFRVQGSGCRVQGSGCRVLGSGFRVHRHVQIRLDRERQCV